MAKHPIKNRLSKEKQQELLTQLCEALVVVRNPYEAANVLKDLLSLQEMEMIAKRLQIAKLLINGKTYAEIQEELKVSQATIGRVSVWLATSGEGFHLVAHRTARAKVTHRKTTGTFPSWTQFKRKHPLHFWPEEVMKEIIQTATKAQKRRILNALEKADAKPHLYKEIEKTLRESTYPNPKNFNTLKYESD